MSEPPEIADRVQPVCQGVWHWRVRNSNIGGAISSSQAVAVEGGCMLIDPVGLVAERLATLPVPVAIALTSKSHQRAAWRYRAEFGAPVWAPLGREGMDEEPDHRYAEGDLLPGGLRALRTPGPEPIHYCLLRETKPTVLFVSDLLMGDDAGGLEFVPAEFHDDPAETRRSVERLAGLTFEVLCLDHGAPIVSGGAEAIRELLQRPA